MDGPRDYHTKRSKLDKGKNHMIPLLCGIERKKIQMNLFTNKNGPTDKEKKLMVTKGERAGEIS